MPLRSLVRLHEPWILNANPVKQRDMIPGPELGSKTSIQGIWTVICILGVTNHNKDYSYSLVNMDN
jgi:hypothetical protein